MKTINYILVTAIVLSFSSCMQQPKEKEITETTSQQGNADKHRGFGKKGEE